MNANDDEGVALLCQCLAAISMADGDLDAREIAIQLSIIEQITGKMITADEVVSATIDVEDWQEFQAQLSQLNDKIEDHFKLQILKACILVGRADDSMIDSEVERIYGVAQILGFSRVEVDEQFKVIR